MGTERRMNDCSMDRLHCERRDGMRSYQRIGPRTMSRPRASGCTTEKCARFHCHCKSVGRFWPNMTFQRPWGRVSPRFRCSTGARYV